MTQRTMRVVGWQVTPIVMADDGEHLDTIPTQTQVIPSRQWEAFKNGGDVAALEQMREQIEQPAPPAGNAGDAGAAT